MKYLLETTILFFLTCTLSYAQNTFNLKLTGESFEGSPIVEIQVDGKFIASIEIKSAIDTTNGNNRLDHDTFDKYVQNTDLILDDATSSGKIISIRLVNDKYGGEGSNQDRNAFIVGASWNGIAIPLTDFTLSIKNVVAAPQPKIVPLPSIVYIATLKIPKSDILTVKTTDEFEKKKTMMAAEEKKKQMNTTTPKACMAADFSVTSFNNAAAKGHSISDIVAQIKILAGDNACTIEITGYSSKIGPRSVNIALSKARAEWVKSQLMQSGINLSHTSLKGAGETSQFGNSSTNRRVVISVK